MVDKEERKKYLIKALFDDNIKLCESEIVEALLYIVSKNSNDIGLAGRMFNELGDLRQCFMADEYMYFAVDGINRKKAAFFMTIGEIYRRIYTKEQEISEIFNYDMIDKIALDEVKDFADEKFVLLFLTRSGEVLSREVFDLEMTNFVNIDINKILRCIPLNKPDYAILFHNHITADCQPTISDDRTTERIIYALKLQNIKLWDHIIVAGQKIFSYRINGDMDIFEKEAEKLFTK